jgi:hypothetical protein
MYFRFRRDKAEKSQFSIPEPAADATGIGVPPRHSRFLHTIPLATISGSAASREGFLTNAHPFVKINNSEENISRKCI